MKAEDVKAFLASLESAQGLTPLDKISMKHKFFQQHIATDPEWATAPPEARMAFAKNYGISPGLAQIGEGEFMQRGLLPKPQGDMGETVPLGATFSDPKFGMLGGGGGSFKENLGDPVNFATGMATSALAKATPYLGSVLGKMLASGNPVMRQAAKDGLLQTGLDWQMMGLNRLPGALYRGASNLAGRLRPAPPAAMMPGPTPTASQLFPIQGGSAVPPPPTQPAPHWLSPPPRSVPPTEP